MSLNRRKGSVKEKEKYLDPIIIEIDEEPNSKTQRNEKGSGWAYDLANKIRRQNGEEEIERNATNIPAYFGWYKPSEVEGQIAPYLVLRYGGEDHYTFVPHKLHSCLFSSYFAEKEVEIREAFSDGMLTWEEMKKNPNLVLQIEREDGVVTVPRVPFSYIAERLNMIEGKTQAVERGEPVTREEARRRSKFGKKPNQIGVETVNVYSLGAQVSKEEYERQKEMVFEFRFITLQDRRAKRKNKEKTPIRFKRKPDPAKAPPSKVAKSSHGMKSPKNAVPPKTMSSSASAPSGLAQSAPAKMSAVSGKAPRPEIAQKKEYLTSSGKSMKAPPDVFIKINALPRIIEDIRENMRQNPDFEEKMDGVNAIIDMIENGKTTLDGVETTEQRKIFMAIAGFYNSVVFPNSPKNPFFLDSDSEEEGELERVDKSNLTEVVESIVSNNLHRLSTRRDMLSVLQSWSFDQCVRRDDFSAFMNSKFEDKKTRIFMKNFFVEFNHRCFFQTEEDEEDEEEEEEEEEEEKSSEDPY